MSIIQNNANKTKIIELMKKSFYSLISSYERGNNEELLEWLAIKINVLLTNQFNWDLYIEKSIKLEWKLTTRTYDLVIKSKKYQKVLLVISINKIKNNINKTFFASYKDIILNTMNLWMENIPYYTLTISPLKTLNNNWQLEAFNKKNLLRLYNWNTSTLIPWINKLMLYNGNISSTDSKVVNDLDTILSSKLSWIIWNQVLMTDIKDLFLDVYNIIQKYN